MLDETVFCGNGSTVDLVEPYKPVAGFAVAAAPPAVSNQYLKGQRSPTSSKLNG